MLKCRKGAVAITFALWLFPALFLVGMWLDFSFASERRTVLQNAADLAVIAAVSGNAPQNQTQQIALALGVFAANTANLTGVSNVAVTANVVGDTATVQYTGASQNNFGGILGVQLWPLSGSSVASGVRTGQAINFTVLVDNSPSMSIPNTANGMVTLMNATANAPPTGANVVGLTKPTSGCSWACHESNPAVDDLGNPGGIDNYAYAAQLGIPLRLATVATSLQQFFGLLGANETGALYTFDQMGVNTLQGSTSNVSALQQATAQIQTLEVASASDQNTDTNFESAMQAMSTIIPNNGVQQVLVIITDGIDDTATGIGLINPAACQSLLKAGVTIAVVWAEYVPSDYVSYQESIAPIYNQIAPTLTACASPGQFYDVPQGSDFNAPLQQILLSAQSGAHLTQ